MPFIVECGGLTGEQVKECMKYYEPVYERNLPAILKCLDGEHQSIECMKLYGATCEGEPKPPKGAAPREANPALYNEYIKPTCKKDAPKKHRKANSVTAPAARFLSSAAGFIKDRC